MQLRIILKTTKLIVSTRALNKNIFKQINAMIIPVGLPSLSMESKMKIKRIKTFID